MARACLGVKRRTAVAQMPKSMALASGSTLNSMACAMARDRVSDSRMRPPMLRAPLMNMLHLMPT